MTAASSLAYSTMEVPTVDDTMEMASPYQGHDDFDIDIDLMEDHISNMDSDMMVADDYPATSQPADYSNDADMADGLSEGSMVDADDNYAAEDHDIDVQFEGDHTFETEMLEGDADEDIDAPIPTIHLEAPPAAGDETNNPTQSHMAATEKPEYVNHLASTTHAQISTHDSERRNDSIHLEPSPTEHSQPEHVSEDAENTQPGVDHEQPVLAETNEAAHTNTSNAPDDHAHAETPVPNIDASLAKSPAAGTDGEHAERPEAHSTHEHEQDDDGTHSDGSLHPVKVLYQENEISLFPPLEGDSSETFFLQDENVAYDDFGKLFRALREVLQDNVAENEILVIDIDALGIQIVEDSSCISKISLHQVLDLYLRLCHNDGTDEPEALYLTLSSKLTVTAEVADLLTAAYEGKGLSQIHSWDEYDEANALEKDTRPGQEQVAPSEESGAQAHETPDTQEETLQAHGDEIPGPEGYDLHATAQSEVTASQPEQGDVNPPKDLDHHEQVLPHGEEYANEETYDSEGQRTESTTTVVPLSRSTETKDPDEDVPVDAASVPPAEDEHGDFPEGEYLGYGNYSGEDEANDIVDGPEEFEDDFAGSDTGRTNVGAGDGAPSDEFTSAVTHYEEDVDASHAAPEYGDVLADESQDHLDHTVHDQPESTSENAPQHIPAGPEQTPEPTNDLLGIGEDWLRTPTQERPNGQLEHADIEEGEYLEEFDASEAVENDDAAGEQFDDDNQYIEAEASELGETGPSFTDSQPHDTVSGKRSREDDEDDWETMENHTPDTKKRRAS